MSIFLLLLLFAGRITFANFCNIWSFYDYNKPSEPFYCADNINCILNCFGQYSCLEAIIYGPNNAELTINCDSSQDIDGPNSQYSSSFACSNMTIYAQHSNKLYIKVYNNPNEFRDNNIYTPYDPNADIPAQYVYNSYISCGIMGTNTKIDEVVNNCGANNNIYSVYGWPTVEWSYAGTGSVAAYSLNVEPGENFTIMHCGVNFADSCITPWYSYYYCDNQQSVCNYLPSSKTPTIATTDHETIVRTCETTSTPTNAPTTTIPTSPTSLTPTTMPIENCFDCNGKGNGGITHCVKVTAVIVFVFLYCFIMF